MRMSWESMDLSPTPCTHTLALLNPLETSEIHLIKFKLLFPVAQQAAGYQQLTCVHLRNMKGKKTPDNQNAVIRF